MAGCTWIDKTTLMVACTFSALLTLSVGSYETVVYIRPTASGDPCYNTPCLTLNQFIQESIVYLGESTILNLMTGEHIVSDSITIANINSFTMVGFNMEDGMEHTHPTVKCNPITAFSFRNIGVVTISGIVFRSCGRFYTALSLIGAIAFHSVQDSVNIGECAFEESFGSALLVLSSNINIYNCSFEANYGQDRGGGMYIDSSIAHIGGNTVFRNNSAVLHGGAVFASDSELYFTDTDFIENSAGIWLASTTAEGFGGAVYADFGKLNFIGVYFIANSAGLLGIPGYGGAVYALFSDELHFTDTMFIANTASSDGGAVSVFHCSITTCSGFIVFANNTASKHTANGGAMSINNGYYVAAGSVNFENNRAGKRGGALILSSARVQFVGSFLCEGNRANYGSGIYATHSNLTFNGKVMFNRNLEALGGGGIAALDSQMFFNGISVFESNKGILGGAVYLINNSIAHFHRYYAINNIAIELGGGLFLTDNSEVFFDDCAQFSGNSAKHGGGIYSESSVLSATKCIDFTSNQATSNGGAVYFIQSLLQVEGATTFIANAATMFGGALYFDTESKLLFKLPLEVNVEQNRAQRGGGIFIDSTISLSECASPETVERCTKFQILEIDSPDCNTASLCFFQFIDKDSSNTNDFSHGFKMMFLNNSALDAGSVVFGGKLDTCQVTNKSDDVLQPQSWKDRVKENDGQSGREVFQDLSIIESETSNISTISSEPRHICFCDSSEQSADIVNCSHTHDAMYIRPGQEFSVYLAAVGDMNGTVATIIRAQFSSDIGMNSQIGSGGTIQQSGTLCAEHRYRVFSSRDNETLILYADGPCRDIGNAPAIIQIHFLPCPDGFILSGYQCVCEDKIVELSKSQLSCNVDNGTIERDNTSMFWIAGEYNQTSGEYMGLISNPICPLDYCTHESVEIKLSFPDEQCNFGHSGILCGGCEQNLSITLGTDHCRKCSHQYIALTIPFALAGIALVIMLFTLRLTVAGGTLSGLIFYANIIAANKNIFFTSNVNILTVFISWINLDLGIESCFYNGMDAYAKVWLQFVFPIYVWLLVGMIILAGTMSQRIARRLGSNPVAVLATLFLLSYTKILRTITAALAVTHLKYQSGDNRLQPVWLYDGNISYLKGKHIPLFIASILMLLVFFIPYTLLLLLGQFLQRYSGKRGLRWTKAFLDAYYAPFCAKHRYWTGLLLILRGIIYAVAVATFENEYAILLVTISLVLGLGIFSRFGGRIYENQYLEALEASYFLNLGILAAATYHIKTLDAAHHEGNQEAVAYLSVSIAFITFIGIVLYHFSLRVKGNTRLWETFSLKFKTAKHEASDLNVHRELLATVTPPTTSFIDLREALLEQ